MYFKKLTIAKNTGNENKILENLGSEKVGTMSEMFRKYNRFFVVR